jgi:hypothetical protein
MMSRWTFYTYPIRPVKSRCFHEKFRKIETIVRLYLPLKSVFCLRAVISKLRARQADSAALQPISAYLPNSPSQLV